MNGLMGGGGMGLCVDPHVAVHDLFNPIVLVVAWDRSFSIAGNAGDEPA